MLLFLPYRTDSPIRRTPWVNYALIGLNVGAFLIQIFLGATGREDVRRTLALEPGEPRLLQFVSYQFLHGDVMHLAGNMLFLWVFGNSVNSKLGQPAYLLFYLACGVLGGVGFCLTESENPVLGASGSIAGITTAYLVFYPRSEVTVFYWIWLYIGATGINSMWLIIGKMIVWDNFLAMHWQQPGLTNVAYSAHLAGYLAGFVLGLVLLLTKSVARDQFDLLSLWRRAYQRRVFASAMVDPNARARAVYGRVARPVALGGAASVMADDPASGLREAVADAISVNDMDSAARKYEELTTLDVDQLLARPYQMAVANHFMTTQRYPQAAGAYEKYLRHYATTEEGHQIRFLLGIIYVRYLQRFDLAKRYLVECVDHLTDPAQKAQADQWLQEIARIAPSA